MSTITMQNKKSVNLTENLYQREKWITKLDQMAQDELSDKNYSLFGEYNNEMIRLSHSKITRHKNLTHCKTIKNFWRQLEEYH